jgi:alginate production protein
MKTTRHIAFPLFCLGLLGGAAGPLYAAATQSTLEIDHKLTVQGGYGPGDSNLGQDRETFYGLRYEPSLSWFSPQREWSTWQGFTRAWINYSSSQASIPLQEQQRQQQQDPPEHFNAELREFYIRRNLLGGDPRFSVSVGRQKFADHYGIWSDDSVEAVRLDYNDTFAHGIVAVGQKFYYYNSDSHSLDESERSVFYGMGEYALRWSANNWVGVHLLLENDHSGDDPDDPSDFKGGRAGLFFYGNELQVSPLFSDYRLELAALKGRVELTDTLGQTSRENSSGWAVLGEVGKRFHDLGWSPRLALRAGLTDKPSDANDGFYLNRIQSDRVINDETYNTGLLGTFVAINLRNLAYYGLTLETQPLPRHYFDVRFSDLYLRDADQGLPLRVAADVSTTGDKSVGQVLDLNYYWKMFPFAFQGDQVHLNLLLSAGYFRAGDAIRGLDDDYQLSFGAVLRY